MIIQTSQINIPTDPTIIKQIRDCMEEVSGAMTRMEGEKSFIKEAIAALSEAVELPKGALGKMARLYHRQNVSEVAADQEAVVDLYSKVFDVEV